MNRRPREVKGKGLPLVFWDCEPILRFHEHLPTLSTQHTLSGLRAEGGGGLALLNTLAPTDIPSELSTPQFIFKFGRETGDQHNHEETFTSASLIRTASRGRRRVGFLRECTIAAGDPPRGGALSEKAGGALLSVAWCTLIESGQIVVRAVSGGSEKGPGTIHRRTGAQDS